jgi:uncharacterized protein (DUF2062 family)
VSEAWRKARTLFYRRILHADDSPHRIALGAAVATFIAFLPIMGIQTVVAVAVAACLRANKAICVFIVWITNPFTAVPIYGSCWWLGHSLTTGSAGSDPDVFTSRIAAANQYSGFSAWRNIFDASFWKSLFAAMLDFGAELWLGCVVVGFIGSLVMYLVARRGVMIYRARREARRMRRHVLRPHITPAQPTPSRKTA